MFGKLHKEAQRPIPAPEQAQSQAGNLTWSGATEGVPVATDVPGICSEAQPRGSERITPAPPELGSKPGTKDGRKAFLSQNWVGGQPGAPCTPQLPRGVRQAPG